MRKVIFTICITFCTIQISIAQSVGINTDGSAPNSSAMLDVKSTTKGLLIPRLTSAERAAIATPAQGLMVFDTDTKSFWFYDGTIWAQNSSSGGSSFWATSFGTGIYNTNTGNVNIGEVLISHILSNNRVTIGQPDDFTQPGFSGNDLAIYNPDGIEGMSLYQSTTASHWYTNTNFAIMSTGSTGYVGIGTETPATKLEVATPNASWGIIHTNGAVRMGTYVGSNGGWIATQSNSPLYFCTSLLNTNGSAQITLLPSGNVGIGTINPAYKLSVNGSIQTKEVRVETGWADYVFDKNYRLAPVKEVEKFISKNNHLPGIPAALEIKKKGLALGVMQTKMMEKIEELTLYIIDLQKQVDVLKKVRAKK